MYADRSALTPGAATIDLGLSDYHKPFLLRTQAELQPVLNKIESWMQFFGFGRRDLFAVRLAATEAVANAMRHGNGGDNTKQVRVDYLVLPDEVLVRVEDQGNGFDPAQVPSPLSGSSLNPKRGLGLFLMRAYTSWLQFNQQGNCVTLCRVRSGA